MTKQSKNNLRRQSSLGKNLTAFTGLLLTMTGCGHSAVIDTRGGGLEIPAILAGHHAIHTQPERATISTEFGSVTVEGARVKVGDAPWKAMPEAVPVALKFSKGKILLTAGNVRIKQTFD